MNKLAPVQASPDLAPAGTPPHIAVAPGVLRQTHMVAREDGETDERYRARCELLALLLDFAAQQG